MSNEEKFEMIWKEAEEAANVKLKEGLESGFHGACGFAWVNIKPANSGFAKWCKAKDYARPSFSEPGLIIWIFTATQSMGIKESMADAMAKVFVKHGIKATWSSRID